MSCPPLIELSQFVDAELDAATMRRIEEHLSACSACAQSVAEFESLARVVERSFDGAPAGAQCPTSEAVLAHLISAPATANAIDAHIDGCDHCARLLQRLQHTLGLMAEMPTTVPAPLRERVAAMSAPTATRPQLAASRASLWERLAAALRYPVLMPAAFATGMLLYVIAQQLPPAPGLPAAASRSVSQPGPVTRRVTVAEAWVYSEPSSRAQVVAKLSRGNAVDISTEERGWCRVALADGRQGWIEGRSLQ